MDKLPGKGKRTEKLAQSAVDGGEVGNVRSTSGRLPALNGQGTLALWNWLISEGRQTFLVYIPGLGGYEVIEFKQMPNKYFILAVCRDKIYPEKVHEFVVEFFTTFGVSLSEAWYLE